MGTLIMPIGISGSGKSTYREKLISKNPNIKVVSPDDIRKSFGDVSDQTKNLEVFNIANHQLRDYISSGNVVYYDATNLTERSRKQSLQICKETNSKLIGVIFLTSFRPDICEERVKKDLSNGKDRSNVLVKDENGNTVVHNQWVKFCNQMKGMEALSCEFSSIDKNYRIIFDECKEK